MGRIVIACYRPKPGKEAELAAVTRTHVPTLRQLGLVTDRQPVTMTAGDGTVIEVFEWASADAIEQAHTHPRVLALWEQYSAVCDYVPLTAVPGADRPFPDFAPLDIS